MLIIFPPPSFFIACGLLSDSQMKSVDCEIWLSVHIYRSFCLRLNSWTLTASLTHSSLATSLPRKETERLPASVIPPGMPFSPFSPRPASRLFVCKRFLRKTLLRSLEDIAEDRGRVLHSNPEIIKPIILRHGKKLPP